MFKKSLFIIVQLFLSVSLIFCYSELQTVKAELQTVKIKQESNARRLSELESTDTNLFKLQKALFDAIKTIVGEQNEKKRNFFDVSTNN